MTRNGIFTALLCVAIGIAIFVFMGVEKGAAPRSVAPLPVRQEPGVEVSYLNEMLWFTFGVPSGLLVKEDATNPDSADVSLYTAAGQEYLSVHAEQSTDVAPLASKTLRESGVAVEDARIVDVADTSGILFSSESTKWSAPSRELWFDRGGYRYKVSVRAQDAALLDFVRATWHWER